MLNAPNRVRHQAKTKEEAEQYVKDRSSNVHVLKLTPELKQKALTEGFPLFSGGVPTFEPVDHDPFEKKKHKLIPVKHDPFKFTPVDYDPWATINPNAT